MMEGNSMKFSEAKDTYAVSLDYRDWEHLCRARGFHGPTSNDYEGVWKLIPQPTEWISINKQEPDPGMDVLVVLDYRPWGRERTVMQARVHKAETKRAYGGPNSLTGSGWLTGIYFSLPSIVAPGVVTFWMHKPELPAEVVETEVVLPVWMEPNQQINHIVMTATVKPLTSCQADKDGECDHPLCPQNFDGEPAKSGRGCPLPHSYFDDERE
jgi:hypothetical protein